MNLFEKRFKLNYIWMVLDNPSINGLKSTERGLKKLKQSQSVIHALG